MKKPVPAPKGPPTISEIDRICQRALQERRASGAVSLLAAPKGKNLTQLVHVGVLGRSHFGPGAQKITKDTLFDLGALTETVATANIALMLMGRGRINMDTTLGQCLPEAARGPLAGLSLGTLLDHTAGLPPGDGPLAAAVARMPAPVRPRVAAAGEQLARITAKVPHSVSGVPQGQGPLSAEDVARLKAALCATVPVRSPGQKAEHAPLGPLLVGWALEAVMHEPLDVLLQQWVVKPLLPTQAIRYLRNGPRGPLAPPPAAAATAPCPWRHRTLAGEAHDKLAWLLGGVAGHSGVFASADGLMRLCLGLLFSLQGVVRYAPGGTLQRFWSRGRGVADAPFTPGWMVACRANGMVPGRWHSRTVGQIDRSGSAFFIDPAFGLVGLVLFNGDADADAAAPQALAHIRERAFDAMASYGQNLAAAAR